MARVTESLIERGELAVPDPGYPPGFLTTGRAGRTYSKYGVGLSVVAIPGYLIGRGLARALPASSSVPLVGPTFLWYDATDAATAWRFFGMSLTNALIVAGVCTLLFLLTVELGYCRRTALQLVALAALATPLWIYSKTFFSEPLAALLLLLFALNSVRWQRRVESRAALRSGFALGGLVIVKLAHVVLWPLALGLWVAMVRTSGLAPDRRRRTWALLAAGPLVGVVTLAILNAVRFGAPWATGYGAEATQWTTAWTEGVLGLLVSPGRGLFIYMPLALVSLLAIPASFRRLPLWTTLGLGVWVVLVAFYCRWHGWDGGWAWGPRFLVPVMPFLLLIAAPAIEGAGHFAGRGWRWLVGVTVAWSIAVTTIGTLVASTEYHHVLRQMIGAGYLPAARWDWRVWAPWGYLHLPKDYTLAWTSLTRGAILRGGEAILPFAFGLLLLGFVVLMVRWKPWRS